MERLQGDYVVEKEPDSDGDENINEPMRDGSKGLRVCGNSNTNSGEETILGLPSDVNVPQEENVYEDLPSGCLSPAVMNTKMCSRDLIRSSITNEICNINVNLSSDSVDPVVSAVDMQDPLFHSEFHIKIEEETVSSVDNDLISENDEFSVSDMQLKVVDAERENDCSGAASHISTYSSHTTPVCERYMFEPSRRDNSNGSSSTEQQNRCQICGEIFICDRHLDVHMRIHTARLFPNNECNNAAISSIKLNKQHIQSGRNIYKCTVCDFKSVHSKSLRKHKRIHSGVKPYKCAECDYAAVSNGQLNRHKRIHSGVKPYKCTDCDYTCADSFSLKRHKRIHVGDKPYKCTECGYAAASNFHLKRHQRIHSGVKPYKCAECDYTAAQTSHLNTHQLIHSGVKAYKCAECDYTAAHTSSLKRHQRIHSAAKSYKCTECDYKAVSYNKLNQHQRIHSGVKLPYKCTECDYASAKSNHVKVHQRIHSGLKPYKCSECDYTTASSSNLDKHRIIHCGVKPYKCVECDYTAVSSSDLNKHKRIHRGVKPYKCAECDYTSARMYNLTVHKRIHSGEIVGSV